MLPPEGGECGATNHHEESCLDVRWHPVCPLNIESTPPKHEKRKKKQQQQQQQQQGKLGVSKVGAGVNE